MEYHSNQRGFSLVELIMAIFLTMMAVGAGYTVYFGSSRAATMQTQDARMQDNARMAMDVLTRNFMRMGFLVNLSNYPPGTLVSGLTSKLLAVNNNNAPDSFTVLGIPDTTIVTVLQNDVAKAAAQLTLASAASFTTGDIIGIGLTDTARVASVAGGGTVINIDTSQPSGAINMNYPGKVPGEANNQEPTRIVQLTASQFSINALTDPLHPVLQDVTGNPVAEDIEDLQIAYGVDRSKDKQIAPGEWVINGALTTDDIELIRLVRVTVVARTAQEDPRLRGTVRTVPTDGSNIEDRPARNVTADGYRRYILTRIIKCRNMETFTTL